MQTEWYGKRPGYSYTWRKNICRCYKDRTIWRKGVILPWVTLISLFATKQKQFYLKEKQLKFVAGEKSLSEVGDLDAFKKRLKEEKTSQWLEKMLHVRFLKNTQKRSTDRTWQWLKGDILRKKVRRWCVHHRSRYYGYTW